MKPAPIRSLIFSFFLMVTTFILCTLYSPVLLMPQERFLQFVRFYLRCVHRLEKYILGLDYEVRGLEHLPEKGPYIVAAKHQAAYETFKLHLLFNNPAIILKKELFKIPLWGPYLKHSDVVAIDRSSAATAMRSMKEGAVRVKGQGRPIIIFPQGTRTLITETPTDKPYRTGVVRIQKATDLPIIPMAVNAGVFCPRNSWMKSPGKVVFEFLPPIPAGLEKDELMKELEDKLEIASNALIDEALGA